MQFVCFFFNTCKKFEVLICQGNVAKKNDKLCCDNYRGINLLSHCEKVMAKVILQRIQRRTEEILSEAQVGFRVKRSTIDQLFTLRLLAEKYVEFGKFFISLLCRFPESF